MPTHLLYTVTITYRSINISPDMTLWKGTEWGRGHVGVYGDQPRLCTCNLLSLISPQAMSLLACMTDLHASHHFKGAAGKSLFCMQAKSCPCTEVPDSASHVHSRKGLCSCTPLRCASEHTFPNVSMGLLFVTVGGWSQTGQKRAASCFADV